MKTIKVTVEVTISKEEFKETYNSSGREVAEQIASCVIGNDFETCAIFYRGEEI